MFPLSAKILLLAILFCYVLRTAARHARIWSTVRKRNRSGSSEKPLPSISVVKPVQGLEEDSEKNFLSFIQSNYPAPFEILFCAEDREDPAVPLIQRTLAEIPSPGDSRLLFSKRQDRREIGTTLSWMAGIRESRYDVLVLSDSDVRNFPGALEELVRPLSEPRVGMVYACPAYKHAENWGAALMGLTVNETVLSFAAVPPLSVIGSSIAIRKDVLRAIGGLGPMRHRIGVDAALGRAVRAKGYRIVLAPVPVTIVHRHGSFRSWRTEVHRWLVTIRRYVGPRYLLMLISEFPVLWGTLFLLISLFEQNWRQGFILWSAVAAVRVASFALVNLIFVKDSALWRYLWLVPVVDFLQVPFWLEGYFNPYVRWRGVTYRVMPDATVRPES